MTWRSKCKKVAVADATLSLVSLAVVEIIAANEVSLPGSDGRDRRGPEILALLVLALVGGIICLFSIVASLMLLHATDMTTDLKVATKSCKYWRMFNIIIIVAVCILSVQTRSMICLTVAVLIRGIFIYIVNQYIEEIALAMSIHTGYVNTCAEVNMETCTDDNKSIQIIHMPT